MLVAGMVAFVSCGPSKKDKEAEQKRLDSLKQDSIAKIKNDLSEIGLIGKVKTLTETSFYAVDKFGKIQKKDIRFKIILLFNKIGNKIEENWYWSDGSLHKKVTYKYDNKGNKTEENTYDSDGGLDYKGIYKYDDKGNIIEENTYNSDGSLFLKTTYKYDGKGNKTEENSYDSDGSFDFKSTFKYDNKGNIIERNLYNSDGSSYLKKYTFKYEYDEIGNRLKKTTFKNGIPESITEREIKYY